MASKDIENIPLTGDIENNEENNKKFTSEAHTVKDEGKTSKDGGNTSKSKGDSTKKREPKSQKKGKVSFEDELTRLTYERFENNFVLNPFNNKIVRLIVCGQRNVGKTSLIERFMTGNFIEDKYPTVGMEFATSTVAWGPHTSIEVEFWDVHGHHFESFVASASCGTFFAAIIVYDCTMPETLHLGATQDTKEIDLNLQGNALPHHNFCYLLTDGGSKGFEKGFLTWIYALRELFETNNCENVPITIVGNKCDLLPRPTITYEDLCSYSYTNGVEGWFVASAKENIEVESAITFAIRSAMQRLIVTEEEVKKGVFHSAKEAIGKLGRRLRHPFAKRS